MWVRSLLLGISAGLMLGDGVGAAPIVLARSSCEGEGSNIQYKACLRKNYEESDLQLNQVYKQVRSKIGAEERKILTDAQVAWITYRDKTCDVETFINRGGTGYRGFLSVCLDRMTQARTIELRNQLDNR